MTSPNAEAVALQARCQFAQELGKKLEEMKTACNAEWHRHQGIRQGLEEAIGSLGGMSLKDGDKAAIEQSAQTLRGMSDAAKSQVFMLTGKEAMADAALDVVETYFTLARDSLSALVNPSATLAEAQAPQKAEATHSLDRPAPYLPHERTKAEGKAKTKGAPKRPLGVRRKSKDSGAHTR